MKNALAVTLLQDHNNKKAEAIKESALLKNNNAKPKIKKLKPLQLDEVVQLAVLMLKNCSFKEVCKRLSQDPSSFNQALYRRGLSVKAIKRAHKLEEDTLKAAA